MRSLLSVLFFAMVHSGVSAQLGPIASDQDQQRYNYTLRHYTVADGLPSRRITSLAQDDQGFIWMASPMGLVRYDGYRFTGHTRAEGLSSDAVRTVLRDADGLLWIQFENGSVDIMDPKLQQVVPFNTYFPDANSESITAMAASAAGTIVYGQEGVLVRYRGAASGLEKKAIECKGGLRPSVVEENGDVWCECGSGFVHTSTQELVFVRSAAWNDNSVPVRWQGITMAPSRGLDLSSTRPKVKEGGYVTLQRSGELLSGWAHPLGELEVHEPVGDNHLRTLHNHRTPLTNDIWLVDGRVTRMQAGDPPFAARVLFDLTMEDADSDHAIISALRDRAGTLWFANDHGLFKLTMDEDRFQRFLYEPTLVGSYGKRIRGITEIGGRLHVNTEITGYFVVDARSGSILRQDTNSTYRISIIPDGNEGLWRASYGDLLHEDPHGNVNRSIRAPQWASSIWSILITADGSLLMGCEGGLRINTTNDSARAISYPGDRELEKATVWHQGRDPEGGILACTDQGLYLLSEQGTVIERWWPGADRINDPLHYLPAADIRHFQVDANGSYWLSTSTSGVLRWDRSIGAVRTFGQRQGFPAASIHAVYPDDQGLLWMPSDNGLIRFDPATEQVRIFTKEDGITHNEFNRVAHHRAANGYFYFGGLNGITGFHPSSLGSTSDGPPAPLLLLSLDIQDQDGSRPIDQAGEIMDGKPLTMRHTDRFFTVGMALLSYDDPHEIRYAWRIDGIDTEWNHQPEPYLRFTTLPFGDHVLRIKAMDRDGRWGANELTIPITMLRPIHIRWWFILTGALALAALIYLLAQYRIRQLREVLRVRDRIALDLHDEVGSNLSSIVLFSTAVGTHAQALPPKAAAMLERITENSTHAMESMNDIVWSVNSGNDQIEDLIDRMRAFAQPLCEAVGVELDLTFNNDLLERKLGMEERKSLYLIFKEALNNAMKHARCTRINVSLSRVNGRYRLVVEDNGRGMKMQKGDHVDLGGNGLGNMRRRAQEIGGTLEVHPAGNGGTKVVLHVPDSSG